MNTKKWVYTTAMLSALCCSVLGYSKSDETKLNNSSCTTPKYEIDTKIITGKSPFPCPPPVFSLTSHPWPNTQVEPSLAVGKNPIDSRFPMVVTFYQEDRYNTAGQASANYFLVSVDGGKTFSDPIPVPTVQCFGGPFERASDPNVVITSNGDILFGFLSKNILNGSVSSVGVAKYNVRKNKFDYVKFIDSVDFFQPPFAAEDFDGIVAETQDDSGKTAYLTWDFVFLNPDNPNFSLITLRMSKTTDGRNWSAPMDVYQLPSSVVAQFGGDVGASFWGITLLNNPGKSFSKFLGTFSLSINGSSPPSLFNQKGFPYSFVSIDQGTTWTNPIPINDTNNVVAGQVVNPNNFQTLIRGASGGTVFDRDRDIIYFLNQEHSLAYDGIPTEMILYVSTDDAASWNQIGPVNTDLSTQAFIANISIIDQGRIAISYYDFRNSTPSEPLLTDRWLDIYYLDKESLTLTLETELRLTEKSFNYLNAPILGQVTTLSPPGLFLGDYMGQSFFERKIYHVYGIVPENEGQNSAHLQLSIITQVLPIPGNE